MRYLIPAILLSLFAASNVRAEIKTFVCDYPTWSDEEGNHPSKNPFVLTFILDSETSKAYLKGNLGTEDVQVVSGGSSITFVEITDTGNVMTTTIDVDGGALLP